jgi:hypothetical protein
VERNRIGLRAALVIGLNLLAACIGTFVLYQGWRSNEARAVATTQNLAVTVDQSIAASVRVIDLMLSAVTDELERQLRTGGRADRRQGDLEGTGAGHRIGPAHDDLP